MGRRAAPPDANPAPSLPLGEKPGGDDAAARAPAPADPLPDVTPTDPPPPDLKAPDEDEDSAGAEEPQVTDVEPLPTSEPKQEAQGIGRVTTLEEIYRQSQGLVHNPFTSY